ncbi:MAG TPA: hypothetical protein PL048_05570 [Leptospiraceae bacterium]|nr:hypothetical protein [Leptospiraceae bacterium]HMY66330.1 hypothetical protein [Leptospiraceae bacterium]HMZ58220.1 hypothetical protein [Leptospiraceae bacterium]HNF16392.1 hypothetical protein [Leptospiraceae bacterium]HNF25293.1 hypothetical protein [Leptospiraceae bacterium]
MNNKQKAAQQYDSQSASFSKIIKPITLVITICIAVAFTELSAQMPRFSKTVILKNGIVFEGVDAIRTEELFTITTPEGMTKVYQSKEISIITWDGSNDLKNAPQKPSNRKWSEDQGYMNWKDAMKKCGSIGMRLPKPQELKEAYAAGITESWKSDARYYWSSERSKEDNWIKFFNIYTGITGSNFETSYHKVRCLISDYIWSEDQGRMNWEDAKKKCESIGMRLPTTDELKEAYAAGITKSWKKISTDNYDIWSSDPGRDDTAIALDNDTGEALPNDREGKNPVRCLH